MAVEGQPDILSSRMKRRIRGRGRSVALMVLASALPLLAEDDSAGPAVPLNPSAAGEEEEDAATPQVLPDRMVLGTAGTSSAVCSPPKEQQQPQQQQQQETCEKLHVGREQQQQDSVMDEDAINSHGSDDGSDDESSVIRKAPLSHETPRVLLDADSTDAQEQPWRPKKEPLPGNLFFQEFQQRESPKPTAPPFLYDDRSNLTVFPFYAFDTDYDLLFGTDSEDGAPPTTSEFANTSNTGTEIQKDGGDGDDDDDAEETLAMDAKVESSEEEIVAAITPDASGIENEEASRLRNENQQNVTITEESTVLLEDSADDGGDSKIEDISVDSADARSSNATSEDSVEEDGGSSVDAADASPSNATSDESLEDDLPPEDAAAVAVADSKIGAPKDGGQDEASIKHVAVDYASKAAGALILDSSANFQGASNLLQKDRDKYAIVACEEPNKYVVIGLSEDILVKQIMLANYERYSSHMKEIHLSGSATTAVGSKDWIDLGTYVTEPIGGGSGAQTFDLTEPTWARYLKIEFLSHYGDEYYCTVSQISVHGSTMVQGFHEQWAELESEESTDKDDMTAEPTANDSSPNDKAGKTDAADEEEASLTNTVDPEEMFDSTEEDADPVEVVESGFGSPRRFPSSLNQCFLQSQSGLVCPGGQDFEDQMLLFLSGNVSEIDESASLALSSASVWLSSSQPATFNKRMSETAPLRFGRWAGQILGRSRALGRSGLLANLSSEHDGVGILSDVLAKPTPIVERIRDLFGNTAKFVSVEGIGDSLLRSLPASASIGGEDDISQASNEGQATSGVLAEDERNESPLAISTSDKAIEKEPDHEHLIDVNHSLANLLRRLPSAKCLEHLDFPDFKKDHLARRSKGNGQTGSSHPSGGPMEPIFKKLTDEIKALQANVAVHDQFARESTLCYQSVILEVMAEIETHRLAQDARISKLENDLHLGACLVALQRFLTSILFGIITWTGHPIGWLVSAWLGESSLSQTVNATIGAVLFVFVGLFVYWRRKKLDGAKWLSLETPSKKPVTLPNGYNLATVEIKQQSEEKSMGDKTPKPAQKDSALVAAVSPEHSVVSSNQDDEKSPAPPNVLRERIPAESGSENQRPIAQESFEP